ncbi:TPA: hypothetical protein DCW38_06310 [candidate division WOR-3 bacterium]|uniref:Glycosyl transferase family 1 domain-containing protein n=1 Tax=candidate division WOR-3 bacterium TaxID=2052148 RepID=A0A350HB60_UNCW3|nr:hypothetical protein [candidate division WOR-3 bacterium]
MRRIAVIGHMHVNPDNRELFELLMETDEIEFLFPKKWRGSFNEEYENPDGFDLIRLPFLKNSYIPLFKDSNKYDIVWIDEEPYYPQSYFILKHFADVPLKIIRTAQNIVKRSFLRDRINNFVNSKSNIIAGVGQTSSKAAMEIYARDSVPVIPLSIPDRFFEAGKNRGETGKEVSIGFASRIERCKGTEWLLESLKEVKYPYKLLICGEGKDKKSFLKQLEERKIKFEYKGLIPHKNMDEFYKETDIFLNLSVSGKKWIEQQGRTVLEAMASGCAVISSDSGELIYTVDEKDYLVKENDIKTLSQKLNELLSDKNKIYELAERQKKTAYRFSKIEIFKKLIEILGKDEHNIT